MRAVLKDAWRRLPEIPATRMGAMGFMKRAPLKHTVTYSTILTDVLIAGENLAASTCPSTICRGARMLESEVPFRRVRNRREERRSDYVAKRRKTEGYERG